MIIFFHIPKTAGSTFLKILEYEYKGRQFTVDGIKWESSLREIEEWDDQAVSGIDLIKGHITYSLKRHHVPKINQAHFISYFREPVSLFLSTFSYIKKAKLNRYHKVAQDMTLTDWIAFRKEEKLENLQSRHLLERLPIYNPNNLNLDLLEKDEETLFVEISNRLDTIDYKFTTDNFDQSLLFLYEELTWKKKPYYERLNISNSKPKEELSAIDLAEIKKINWLDMYLFDQVTKIEKIQLGTINDDKLNTFRKRNRNHKVYRLLNI